VVIHNLNIESITVHCPRRAAQFARPEVQGLFLPANARNWQPAGARL